MYRLAPPAPNAHDWADEPGWSDSIVTGDELKEEISRLNRGELLLTGRVLSIEWLNDDESAVVEARYFSRGAR